MPRPKPLFERAMVRIPGELVTPVRALVKAFIEQKRLAKRLEQEKAKQQQKEGKT